MSWLAGDVDQEGAEEIVRLVRASRTREERYAPVSPLAGNVRA
jgi:hypothetical protein